MRRPVRWGIAVTTLVALAALVPATADWLVTREGERVETEGPWRVEDRLVVFKRPDGTFASLRVADVDLEASDRLTREMAEKVRRPEAPKESPSRPVIARLTEKDLPPVGARREKAGGDGTTPPEGGDGEEEESFRIVNWRELGGPGRDGIDFVGDVRNVTEDMALGVEVTVTVYDEAGEEIRSQKALLTTAALPAGQTAGFRASFPGVYHYARVQFLATGRLVLSGPPPEEEGSGGPGR